MAVQSIDLWRWLEMRHQRCILRENIRHHNRPVSTYIDWIESSDGSVPIRQIMHPAMAPISKV
jgi:hypothetical protein